MERIRFQERADWRAQAEQDGFSCHTINGERYWDERHAYFLTGDQVKNDLQAPTNELMGMCYEAVRRIAGDPALMLRMAIPQDYHGAILESYNRHDKDLYGRFDYSYDGKRPPKLLEFNADTPTSLFESAVFQWKWLEETKSKGLLPHDADQFNDIHERLVEALRRIGENSSHFHVGAMATSEEDVMNAEYIGHCAAEAGLEPVMIDMADLGVDGGDWFTDLDDCRIANLFKLYPLEMMIRQPFGTLLKTTPTKMFEPLWKLVLSNKGLLPVLWEMYPDHPNLLPSFFEDDRQARALGDEYVRKPLLSREGENVSLISPRVDGGRVETGGEYGKEGSIVQAVELLPRYGDDWTLVGSWVVAGQAAGIGIREDDGPVTKASSRFVPHYVLDR
jgi:glutathionylspermidine synthase